jgi:hypothetical protein
MVAVPSLPVRFTAVWPEVLCRSVDGELRPIVTFLMALGIEVSDIAGEAAGIGAPSC